MGGTWAYLDLTALGRQEDWEDSPEGYPQTPPYSWGDGTTPTATPPLRLTSPAAEQIYPSA
jgi:hypothetical protein